MKKLSKETVTKTEDIPFADKRLEGTIQMKKTRVVERYEIPEKEFLEKLGLKGEIATSNDIQVKEDKEEEGKWYVYLEVATVQEKEKSEKE